MAKFQWTAASETLGQPPSLLTDVCDGSISDWEIVADVGASNGQALKLVSGSSARRRLAVPGISSGPSGRIDIRGRFYRAQGAAAYHIAICNSGTSAANSTDTYWSISGTHNGILIDEYRPSYANVSGFTGEGGNVGVGWWNFRYTFDPSATYKRVCKVWSDSASEVSPDGGSITSQSALDAAITGDRVCIGTGTATPDSGQLIDWITVGTGGDDADLAPSGGQVSHPLAGAATVSASASGDLTTAGPTPTKGVSLTLHSGQTAQAGITGITACWWDTSDPSAFAAPVYNATASTDGNGVLTLDLDEDTALDIGQSGFLLLFKAGASAADDLLFAGRLAVQDIA